MEFVVLTILRLLVPLLILRWPLTGIILAAILDLRDWDFLGITIEQEMHFYQNWDKILDTYYLGIAWYTSRSWKDTMARKLASILFFYRLFGVVLITFGVDRSILLFFPNIFEIYFVFYLLFVRVTKQTLLFWSKKIMLLVLLALAIPKIAQEFFMHVLRNYPWEVFNIAKITGIQKWIPDQINGSYWIWILIFLAFPLTALVWCICMAFRHNKAHDKKDNSH